MTSQAPDRPVSIEPAQPPGPVEWTLFLLALGAIAIAVGVAAAITVSTFRLMEALQRSTIPNWIWPATHMLGLMLAAGVVGLLGLIWSKPPIRSFAVGLAGLGVMGALLGLTRFVDVNADGWRAALMSLIAVLSAVAALMGGRAKPSSARHPAFVLLALSAAVLLATPWLVFGALDSFGRLVGDTAAGLLVGLATALWLDRFIFGPATARIGTRKRSMLAAGFVAAVGLLLIGVSVGANGMQLLYAPALAALGWLAAWLDRAARDKGTTGVWATTVLIAVVLAIALAAFDPEEQSLFLLEDAVGLWATAASLTTAFVAIALGLLAIALDRPSTTARPTIGRALSAGLLAVALVVAAGAYVLLGHPGLYGERLFVIMRDQADLSAIDATLDQKARAAEVYAELTAHAQSSQADLRSTLDSAGIAYTPYYLVNALEVDGGALVRLYLSTRPDVGEVLLSQRLRPVFRDASPATGQGEVPIGPEWNIVMIGADRVWSEFGVTGEGIVVGQSDSGVAADHPAIAAQYRGNGSSDDYNWIDPWDGTLSPVDIGGHGTHTLGTILGTNGIGVAPGAQWFACRNLARNLGNPALYLGCMQFMLAPYPANGDSFHDGDPARGANVLNNSWGCPPIEGCDAPSLRPAVDALRAAGIFVVASAGNDGPSCSTLREPIAIYDSAFTVAAVDDQAALASFSSRGPVPEGGPVKPDIAAPGVNVLSGTPDGGYTRNSGTSMAGPHLVGVVALMWSANPALIGDIDTTEQILRETATSYTGPLEASTCDLDAHPEWAVGAGTVNAYAAVQSALELATAP